MPQHYPGDKSKFRALYYKDKKSQLAGLYISIRSLKVPVIMTRTLSPAPVDLWPSGRDHLVLFTSRIDLVKVKDYPLETGRIIKMENYIPERINGHTLPPEGGILPPVAPVYPDDEDLVLNRPG